MKQLFFCALLITMISCAEKESYSFKIKSDTDFLNSVPVSIDLSQLQLNNFGLFQDEKIIPFQIDSVSNTLTFIHPPEHSLYYILKSYSPKEENPKVMNAFMNAFMDDGDLKLTINQNPVLQYRYEMNYPPAGVDSIFKKSGYIHPLLTPRGDTLTRINPPDHYHHYGIWGPWTRTRIDTMRVDFWNLIERQGTVLFKKFNATTSGSVNSSFTAIQEHIDFKTKSEPQVAINETLKVTLWNLNRPDRYMIDYSTTFSSPLKNGIVFEAYRYGGGVGMRFTERWHKGNSEVLTSEGKNRLDSDGTNARWAMVTGESSDGKRTNGILFMSYPENRMHPEPMRVWPTDGWNSRGDMFFQFCPIRDEEWKIEPDTAYNLNYRMVVFEGSLTAKEAEDYWKNFANPIQMETVSNTN